MRVVIQRVNSASVEIHGNLHSSINRGFLVLLGIENEDAESDAEWLAGKIAAMRIFSDAEGKMNHSVADIKGELLVVSQFTLHASTKKGNRPSFINAARPEKAIPLYEFFVKQLEHATSSAVQTGKFGADMQVKLINDGPVTIVMDSRNRE